MKKRKGYRKIVVDCINWQWKKTRQNIVAYPESGKKLIITVDKFIETYPSVIQEWPCGEKYIEILPKEIAEWIHKNG